MPCEGDLTPRTAVLGLGLLLFLATPAQLQQLRIESGSVLTPCRETRGQLPGGALSYDYTKALLARVEACALFNRRFMAEVGTFLSVFEPNRTEPSRTKPSRTEQNRTKPNPTKPT